MNTITRLLWPHVREQWLKVLFSGVLVPCVCFLYCKAYRDIRIDLNDRPDGVTHIVSVVNRAAVRKTSVQVVWNCGEPTKLLSQGARVPPSEVKLDWPVTYMPASKSWVFGDRKDTGLNPAEEFEFRLSHSSPVSEDDAQLAFSSGEGSTTLGFYRIWNWTFRGFLLLLIVIVVAFIWTCVRLWKSLRGFHGLCDRCDSSEEAVWRLAQEEFDYWFKTETFAQIRRLWPRATDADQMDIYDTVRVLVWARGKGTMEPPENIINRAVRDVRNQH